jgi:hypothetical protein
MIALSSCATVCFAVVSSLTTPVKVVLILVTYDANPRLEFGWCVAVPYPPWCVLLNQYGFPVAGPIPFVVVGLLDGCLSHLEYDWQVVLDLLLCFWILVSLLPGLMVILSVMGCFAVAVSLI